MNRRLIFIAVLTLMAFFVQGEELVIGVGVPVESSLYGYWTDLFEEVERRSQGALDIKVESMSLARARKSLLDGNTDADAGRTQYVYESEEGVVRLEPPLFTNSYHVFAMEGLDIGDSDDIRKYRLATISGNVVLNRFVRDNGLDTLLVNDNEQALRMILYDRVDCLIATDLESPMLENREFKGKGLIMYPQVIFQTGIYLFLSDDRRKLIPLVEGILTELQKEGKLEAYLKGEAGL